MAMLDIRPIVRCLPRHFGRSVLLVLALCCFQAGVLRWGPQWMHLVDAWKGEMHMYGLSLAADRRTALTQVSIARSVRQRPDRVLFMHRPEEQKVPQRLLLDQTDVVCAAMTRDATHIAVATGDGLVQVLADLESPNTIHVDRIAPDRIVQMHWTSDGSKLVALGTDFIYVWLYPECDRLHRLPRRPRGAARFELAPDCQTLLLFDCNHYDVWNLTTGHHVKSVELPSYFHAVALSSDSRFVALAFRTGVCVWDLHHERVVWQSNVACSPVWQSLAISPDDSLVASIRPSGNAAPRIVIQRLSDGEAIATVQSGVSQVSAVALATNTELWICGYEGILECREIPSGKELWRHNFAALN